MPGLKYLLNIRPYWSRQHGAYITMIISWLIGVLLSKSFTWIQPVILIFLLSSLNLAELLIESFIRKSSLHQRKKFWLSFYFVISIGLSFVLYFYLKSISYFLPAFLLFGLIFIILALKRKHKTVVAEWITFAIFSFAGILAFNPTGPQNFQTVLIIGSLMSVYFGQSIFLVKSRLKSLPSVAALLYSVLILILVFLFLGFDQFTFLFGILLMIKSMHPLIFGNWYGALKIKWVGMLELGYHVVFLLLLLYSSEYLLKYHESL